MNPKTPTNPGSAMLQGGTFMRPGAVAWGYPEQPGTLESDLTLAATEHALAAAAKDPDRVTDLLDELSRGRLWLPLPEDERPVTDGSAVLLPTGNYLGAEFGPAGAGPPGRCPCPPSRCRTTLRAGPQAETARSRPCRTSWSRPPSWPGCCRPAWASRSTREPGPVCPSTPKGSVTWPRRWSWRTAPVCGWAGPRPIRSRC